MNRTGLVVAVAAALIVGLVFGIYPRLDLKIAAAFYDDAAKAFSLRSSVAAGIVRDGAMWIAWAFAAPAIIAFVVKMIRPDRPLLVRGRAVAFLLITIVLAAGVLTNLTFKSHWGRPRPAASAEFGGQWPFRPYWDPRGLCPKNCSFFSGEAATAFWTYAPAALAPPQWRPLAYAGATLFGLATGALRMAFGGHYLSDVLIAGIVTFLVIWLVHFWLYRSRRHPGDADIDLALTRLAWPGFTFVRKIFGKQTPPPANQHQPSSPGMR